MLKRLQNSSPTYNVDKWEEDREKSLQYLDLGSKYPYAFNSKTKKPRLMHKPSLSNSTTFYGSKRQGFPRFDHKPSNSIVNITTYDDGSAFGQYPNTKRCTTLSTRRIDGNLSILSKGYSDSSELPEIAISKDSIFIPKNGPPVLVEEQNEREYEENMKRLEKIRASVRSVSQINPVKRKRLYQGIAIISQKEFFIDICKTKVKFYISAIELDTKTPYMIELYLSQGKKILKECHDNFDNLVMKLEFKFNKLTITDMHKMLYQDYSSYATQPSSPKLVPKRQLIQRKSNDFQNKGYAKYFHNRPMTLRNSANLKLKSNLNVSKGNETADVLHHIENLIASTT